MPGITVVRGSQPVEYVEETSFATEESDGTYQWIGLVTSFSPTIATESETAKYLPDDASGIDLSSLTNVKVSELHNVDVTYHPQDLTFLQYFTGAAGSLSDSLTSIQFGEQDKDNGEFHRLLGAVGEEFTLSIEEDSIAEVDGSFLAAADTTWSDTDYIGTGGSHATANTAEPLSYDDLGNVQWGGAALTDAVESLELTVSNSLEVVKDPDSTLDSHIEAIAPVDREVTVDIGITFSSFSMASDVRSLTSQDLTFEFPAGTTWTVSDVAFPELPWELGPEDLVSDSLSSLPSTDLAYA